MKATQKLKEVKNEAPSTNNISDGKGLSGTAVVRHQGPSGTCERVANTCLARYLARLQTWWHCTVPSAGGGGGINLTAAGHGR